MKKISSLKIFSLMGGVMLMTAPQSHAASKSANMNVTVKVVGACTLAANTLDFGSYESASTTDVTANTTISVTCPNQQTYTVALNAGSSAGGTFANRKLINGANTLNYNLYKEPAYTNVWGDGTGTTQTTAGTGTGNSQTLTVYGKIAAGQTPTSVGNPALTDTVTVTLTY